MKNFYDSPGHLKMAMQLDICHEQLEKATEAFLSIQQEQMAKEACDASPVYILLHPITEATHMFSIDELKDSAWEQGVAHISSFDKEGTETIFLASSDRELLLSVSVNLNMEATIIEFRYI